MPPCSCPTGTGRCVQESGRCGDGVAWREREHAGREVGGINVPVVQTRAAPILQTGKKRCTGCSKENGADLRVILLKSAASFSFAALRPRPDGKKIFLDCQK